jgi:hypothetical protein
MINNKDLEIYNKKLISFLQATNELPQDFNNTDLLIDVIAFINQHLSINDVFSDELINDYINNY